MVFKKSGRIFQLNSLEILLALLVLLLAASPVLAFILDIFRLPINAATVGLPVLLLGSCFLVVSFLGLGPTPTNTDENAAKKILPQKSQLKEFVLFCLITGGVLTYALSLSWPALLPIDISVDAVQQYALANYVQHTQQLPIHAIDQQATLQWGIYYPPAFVTIVALLCQLTNVDPIQMLYPVVAFCTALSTGLVFAISARLLPTTRWRLVLSGLAGGFSLLPYGYVFGSFTFQSYFAQVLAHTYLLLGLYFGLSWQQAVKNRYRRQNSPLIFLVLLQLIFAALIICYPTFALVPLATFGLQLLFQPKARWSAKLINLLWFFLPLVGLASLFLRERINSGMEVIANEGSVLLPDIAHYGWPVVICAVGGLLVFGLCKRQEKIGWLVVFTIFLVLEGVGLYLLKTLANQASYYAIYKLFYFGAYIIPLLAVFGLAYLLIFLETRIFAFFFKNFKELKELRELRELKFTEPLASVLVFGIFLAGTWLAYPPGQRPFTVLTADHIKVAYWIRDNLELNAYSTEYAVNSPVTAYWLHVGIFKQPRNDKRAEAILHEPAFTFASWLQFPDTPQYLFTEQAENLPLDGRYRVLQRSGAIALLEHTEDYWQKYKNQSGLALRYTTQLKENELSLRTLSGMSDDVSGWLGVALELIRLDTQQVVYSEALPAEPGRIYKRQYIGFVLTLPKLTLKERYSNQQSLPPLATAVQKLATGKYRVNLVLQKKGKSLECRQLFDFEYTTDAEPIKSVDNLTDEINGEITFNSAQLTNLNLAAYKHC